MSRSRDSRRVARRRRRILGVLGIACATAGQSLAIPVDFTLYARPAHGRPSAAFRRQAFDDALLSASHGIVPCRFDDMMVVEYDGGSAVRAAAFLKAGTQRPAILAIIWHLAGFRRDEAAASPLDRPPSRRHRHYRPATPHARLSGVLVNDIILAISTSTSRRNMHERQRRAMRQDDKAMREYTSPHR